MADSVESSSGGTQSKQSATSETSAPAKKQGKVVVKDAKTDTIEIQSTITAEAPPEGEGAAKSSSSSSDKSEKKNEKGKGDSDASSKTPPKGQKPTYDSKPPELPPGHSILNDYHEALEDAKNCHGDHADAVTQNCLENKQDTMYDSFLKHIGFGSDPDSSVGGTFGIGGGEHKLNEDGVGEKQPTEIKGGIKWKIPP